MRTDGHDGANNRFLQFRGSALKTSILNAKYYKIALKLGRKFNPINSSQKNCSIVFHAY